LDIDAWPGPDRKKWPGLRDIIVESPGGSYLAVVYSCGEVGVGKEVGLFALFAGPSESPRLLLRPRRFRCVAFLDDSTIRWMGDNICTVTPYLFKKCFLGGPSAAMTGTAYFNVEQRKVAYVADLRPNRPIEKLPDGLVWRDWWWLALWPWLLNRL